MKRRGNNEGSITERPDGRWEVRISVVTATGKRDRITRYAKTHADARRLLTALKKDQDIGIPIISGKETVSQWLDAWLALYIAPPRRKIDGHLLSIHHHEAILAAPALRLPFRRSLKPSAGQSFHFLRHCQQHQLQPGFPKQLTSPLLGQHQYLDHRQHELHHRVIFFRPLPYSLYGAARANLVWFLH